MLPPEERMILNVEDACKRILFKPSSSSHLLGHIDYTAIVTQVGDASTCITIVMPTLLIILC